MVINREDYTERAMLTSMTRINVLCIVIAIPIAIISVFMYEVLNIDKNLDSLYLFLLLFIGIILHELIHRVVAVRYAQTGWKSIKLGILWRYILPYCHCKEALTVSQYRKVIILPTLVAIVCLIISFFVQNWTFTLFCLMMVASGAGDIYVVMKLRDENPETIALYYPDKVGSAILEKKDETK